MGKSTINSYVKLPEGTWFYSGHIFHRWMILNWTATADLPLLGTKISSYEAANRIYLVDALIPGTSPISAESSTGFGSEI